MESLTGFRVVVLMGGTSKEREVSLATGRAVMEACETMGFRKVVAFDPGMEPLESLMALRPFIAFNALHGKLGEDGCIQGFMEVLGMPLTGPSLLPCALSMDKWLTKKILRASGLPVPKAVFIDTEEGTDLITALNGEGLGFPLVVKPNQEGSSLGIRIVKSESELRSGLKRALGFGGGVLIEEFIDGAEVQTAVLDGKVIGSIEIRAIGEFYDYYAKYTPGGSEHILPPSIDPSALNDAEQIALKTHRALDLDPLSRIDLRVHPQRGAFVLEANALPGMTPTSLVPEIARHAGISFDQLILTLIQHALKRSRSWPS